MISILLCLISLLIVVGGFNVGDWFCHCFRYPALIFIVVLCVKNSSISSSQYYMSRKLALNIESLIFCVNFSNWFLYVDSSWNIWLLDLACLAHWYCYELDVKVPHHTGLLGRITWYLNRVTSMKFENICYWIGRWTIISLSYISNCLLELV